MKRTLVEAIERAVGRRSFLKRTALVSGAFIGGLLGASNKAAAGGGPCCGLCKPSGNPPWPQNCACAWCWVCKDAINCLKYKCKECIQGFGGACTPSLCRCHSTDVHDACRTCLGVTVVASEQQLLGKYTPCQPR